LTMSIVTQALLESMYPGTYTGVSTSLWRHTLASCDALLRTYLGAFDANVLSTMDISVLRTIAIDYARYVLRSSLPYDEVMNEDVTKRWLLSKKILEDIKNGVVVLETLQFATQNKNSSIRVYSVRPECWENL